MRKKLFTILCVVFLLSGCGVAEDKYNATEETTGSQATEVTASESTVLVSNKEKVKDESSGKWQQTAYIDGTLYFSVSNYDEDTKTTVYEVYEKKEDSKPQLRLTLEHAFAMSVAIDRDGSIFYVEKSGEEKPEYFVVKVGVDGKEIFRNKLSESAECIEMEFCADAAVSEGGYCVLTTQGTCLMWDALGAETGCVTAAWYMEGDDYYIDGELGLVNGSEGVYVYHTDAHAAWLQLADAVKGELREEVKVQVSAPDTDTLPDNMVRVYSGYEKGLYITDADILYHYDCSKDELSSLLSWLDPGINVKQEMLREVGEDEEGNLILYGYDRDKKEASVYRMKEVSQEDFTQGHIEIGYIWETSEYLEKYVDGFNESQSEIVVSLKKYEDETALHLDLIQGEGPDILELYNLDIGEYAEKGILENLDMYLESSAMLNKEDILLGVFEAMQKDGHVYCLFPYFSFSIIILQEGFAENGVISIEEFLSLKPDEGNYLCEFSMSTVLSELFNADKGMYIDWENRSCCFDDGRYADLLRKVKNAELSEKSNTAFSSLTPAEQIYQGKYLAMFSYVNNANAYVDCREAFDGYAEIIGYPNSLGKEVYPIKTGYGILGINKESDQKEAAWEFLEYYINAYADSKKEGSTFSVLKDAFEEQLYIEKKQNHTIKATNIYLNELEEISYDIPEEYCDELRRMTESVVWAEMNSGPIGNIIWEESSYFLYGDKTAEEVADIIQSRVSLYMAE